MAVESMPVERELQYRQLDDPNICDIAQRLKEAKRKKFILIDGLVYRKDSSRPKFIISEAIYSLLRIYHDNAEHCDAKKTFYTMSANY